MSGFGMAVVWGIPVVLLLALACRRFAASSRKGAARACAAGVGAVIVLEAAWMAATGIWMEPSVSLVVLGVALSFGGVLVGSLYWRSVR